MVKKKLGNSDKKVCNFCLKETESSFHKNDFWTLHPEKLILIYRTVPSAIWEIFSEFFSYFATYYYIAKYETRRKYLPILYEATRYSYFIVMPVEIKYSNFTY